MDIDDEKALFQSIGSKVPLGRRCLNILFGAFSQFNVKIKRKSL